MENSFEPGSRKVYFFFNHPAVDNRVVKKMVYHEFEAYSMPSNVDSCLPLINGEGGSIVFAMQDNCPRHVNWERCYSVLNAMEGDSPHLISTWYMESGILKVRRELTNFEPPVGNIDLSGGLDAVLSHVIDYLTSVNARGRRKYIRTRCDGEYGATFSVKFGKNIIGGMIHDISSYGMACSFNADLPLVPRSYLADMQLRLNGVGSAISGEVFGKREMDGRQVYVIIFDYSKHPATRQRITDYIYYILQRDFRSRAQR